LAVGSAEAEAEGQSRDQWPGRPHLKQPVAGGAAMVGVEVEMGIGKNLGEGRAQGEGIRERNGEPLLGWFWREPRGGGGANKIGIGGKDVGYVGPPSLLDFS
jgi:hypothetical protein